MAGSAGSGSVPGFPPHVGEEIVRAVGVWSFLAVFPPASRMPMASRLGSMPSVEDFFASWELFGYPLGGKMDVVFKPVEGFNQVVIGSRRDWPYKTFVGVPMDKFAVCAAHLGLWTVVGYEPDESEVWRYSSYEAALEAMGFQADESVAVAELEEVPVQVRAVDGWCYTDLPGLEVSPGYPWPTVAALEKAGVSREDIEVSVERVAAGVLHVVPGPVERVAVSVVDVVGGSVGGTSTYNQLDEVADFTVCKCRVHAAPMLEVGGSVVGCGVKQVGKHPAIAAAASGVHRYCHASEQTREADRAFLEVTRAEPQILAPSRREMVLPEFASTSSVDVKEFGRGYCHLRPVHPRLRWRSARVLGPNPLCADVLQVWKWVAMKEFKHLALVRVAPGWYHVEDQKGAKGTAPDAGLKLLEALQAIVLEEPEARIGVDFPPGLQLALAEFKTHLRVAGFEGSLSKQQESDFALAFTPAASLGSDDKVRKRVLEAAGDSYLTLVVAHRALERGKTVQWFQEERSRITNNKTLTQICWESPVGKCVSWPAGSRETATPAKSFEGLIGCVGQLVVTAGLAAFLEAMGCA